MSQHLFNDTDITAIANAIRTKKGTQNTMTITQMPAEIESIPSGGSTDPVAVRFLDFDGTVVQELNDNGLNGLIALPEAPDHSQDEIPLTFDEWNWALTEIKDFRHNHPTWTVNVGANYHTTDGLAHIIVETEQNYAQSTLYPNDTMTADWGNGTITPMTSGGNFPAMYMTPGRYHIKITCESQSLKNVRIECDARTKVLEVRQSTNICVNSDGSYFMTSKSIPSNHTSMYVDNARSLKWFTIPRQGLYSYTYNGMYSLKYQPLTYACQSDNLTQASMNYALSLEEIYFPSYIKHFTSSAFNSDSSLKRIHIASTSTTMSIFTSCGNLEEISIPSTITSIPGSGFNKCFSLKKVVMPNTITSIGGSAFMDCFNLKDINISTGVTAIPMSCFANCYSLEEITVPQNVTSIGNSAFSSCSGLTLIMKPTNPPTLTNNNAIKDVRKILVPYSSDLSVINAYRSANYWTNYQTKIFQSPAPTE